MQRLEYFKLNFLCKAKSQKQALTAQTYTAQQWAELQDELNAECGLTMQLQKQLQILQKQYNTLLTRSIVLNEDYRDLFKDKFRSVEVFYINKN